MAMPSTPSRNNAIRREAPGPRPPMTVTRRADARVLQYSRQQRDWSTDLFDCVDHCHGETCMQATFCPCVLYANNKRRFEHLQSRGYPHPTLSVTKDTLRQALRDQRQTEDDHDGVYHQRRPQQPKRPQQRAQPQESASGGCFCVDEQPEQQQRPTQKHHFPAGPNDPVDQHDHDHEYNDHHEPQERAESGFFSSQCLMHAFMLPCGVGLVFQAMFRQQIRKRYRIRGEVWDDGLAAFCCGPCELVQESRELEAEERMFILKPVEPPRTPRRAFRIF